MSNTLAIATVTATLADFLQNAVVHDIPAASVTTVRPDAAHTTTPATGINVYLYQVTPNAAWRNSDLPTRRPNGSLVQTPMIPLDVCYLLTFYGDESKLEPQRLLGDVVSALHAQPLLARANIRAALASRSYLNGSNLADQVESVRFTPLPLTLEELSKLWSVFFQIPYTLSLAYQGSVVLIETADLPQPALPVRQRNIVVLPFSYPNIDQVSAAEGIDQPIVAGGTLVISGQNFSGPDSSNTTLVQIGDLSLTPMSISATQMTVQLPTSGLYAGVQGVQVIQQTAMGSPQAMRQTAASNVAAFVFRPVITSVIVNTVTPQATGTTTATATTPTTATSANLVVQVSPAIGSTQRVLVLLNELTTTTPAAYTFLAPACPGGNCTTLTIPLSGVTPGTYIVRIQVDGAESPVTISATTNTPSPTVNVS